MPQEVAMMMTPWTRYRRLACILTAAAAAALAAGTLITAAGPQLARAQDSGAGAAPQAGTTAAGSGGSWCASIPPGYAHPPLNQTPVTVQLTRPSVEPVPAGRAHPPLLRGTGDQHASNAGRHRQRRAGRCAGRLHADRVQPHHGHDGQ